MSDRSYLEVEVPTEQWEQFKKATGVQNWEEEEPGRGGRTILAGKSGCAGGDEGECAAAIEAGLDFLATHGRHYAYDGGVSASFGGESVLSIWALGDDPSPAVTVGPNGPDPAELRAARAYWQIRTKFEAAYPAEKEKPDA